MSDVIYVRWSDDGQHIRKWSREPFGGGEPMYSRSFLLSEERVEAVARSLCIASISGGHPDDITLMERPLWTEWEHDARAALAAAMGGDDDPPR